MTTLTLGKALNEGLRRAMETDPKVLIMGEDVGRLDRRVGGACDRDTRVEQVAERVHPPDPVAEP